jgi:ribosome biogenesis protein MAK21
VSGAVLSMAKSKGKRSAAVDDAPAATEKSSNPAADSFLELDQSALASLTSKIERKLKGGEGSTDLTSQKYKGAVKAKDSKKGAKGSESKPNAKPDSNKGKKRDRNGEVIARQDAENRKDNAKPDDGDNEDPLRQEILALGGSKEDYELLAGVESGSEVEQFTISAPKSKSKGSKSEDALRADISKMMKGFEPSAMAEDSDTSSEADEPPASTGKSQKEAPQREPLKKDPPKKEAPKKEAPKKEASKKNGAEKDASQKDGPQNGANKTPLGVKPDPASRLVS